MICKHCGKIYGGEHCVFCGAATGRARTEQTENADIREICLNCGARIPDILPKCLKCGVPRGMTARQARYADFRENKFDAAAVLLAIVTVVLYAVNYIVYSVVDPFGNGNIFFTVVALVAQLAATVSTLGTAGASIAHDKHPGKNPSVACSVCIIIGAVATAILIAETVPVFLSLFSSVG